MFKARTLFIVGAGASCEANLPTNFDLKNTIAHNLDIRFEYGSRQISGNSHITEALRKHVRNLGDQPGRINAFFEAAWAIRDGMPQSISIDNYIDAHRGNEKIELCGKLAIAHSILEAEKNSKLYIAPGKGLEFEGLQNTWYLDFSKMLTEGVAKNDIETIFTNISFVSFNYDRCIEHFLPISLANYYRIQSTKADALVQKLTILHPYGVVGELPWQRAGHGSVPFGELEYSTDLLAIAKQIKTFTEQIENVSTLNSIREEVQRAEVIVFLGFGFNQQNIDLIRPSVQAKTKRVFGTTMGISQNDTKLVFKEIQKLLQKSVTMGNLRNSTCSQLFGEFWRSLTAPV